MIKLKFTKKRCYTLIDVDGNCVGTVRVSKNQPIKTGEFVFCNLYENHDRYYGVVVDELPEDKNHHVLVVEGFKYEALLAHREGLQYAENFKKEQEELNHAK